VPYRSSGILASDAISSQCC